MGTNDSLETTRGNCFSVPLSLRVYEACYVAILTFYIEDQRTFAVLTINQLTLKIAPFVTLNDAV